MDLKDYKHTISDWALIFRNGLVDIPEKLDIHPDFLRDLSKIEFEETFRYLWHLFYQIYTDAAADPRLFGVSVDDIDNKIQGGPAGNILSHMKQLYLLFKSGDLQGGGLFVNTASIKKSHVKVLNTVLSYLSSYGFEYEGLDDGRVTSKVSNFIICYPDNPAVINVLYLVAKKAARIRPYIYSNNETGGNEYLFKTWNFRLIQGAFGEYEYNDTYIFFRDSLHKEEQKQFLDEFHKAMLARGYFIEHWPGRGPGHLSYFHKSIKEPYYFDVCEYNGHGMYVRLRIRNDEKCFDYIKNCPDRIKEEFKTSYYGCGNHESCKIPHKYTFEGVEVSKCACCGPGHEFEAHIEDIPHYINLVELSVKR